LREAGVDRRGTVDDPPFGGGPGQVFRVEPIVKTLAKIKKAKKQKIVLLSASGKKWTQQLAQKYSQLDQVIFVCPRYEGVDERVKKFVDDEISIGDYVLTGGELGALVMIDSITRLLPGVLHTKESLDDESHHVPGYLEYPQYTRPEVFTYKKKNYRVPKILLSGHHVKINEWRAQQSAKKIINKPGKKTK
jgi:tRNA (guanine37-N1)-methyltransferase